MTEKQQETIRSLLHEFVREIAWVKGNKIKKSSMATKLPRLICDKMWEMATTLKNVDKETIVDAGVSIFVETMNRQQKGNETFLYCKGYKDGKIMSWMERFVNVVDQELDGNFGRLRTFRDNVILPIFKAEAIRANQEHWKPRHDVNDDDGDDEEQEDEESE